MPRPPSTALHVPFRPIFLDSTPDHPLTVTRQTMWTEVLGFVVIGLAAAALLWHDLQLRAQIDGLRVEAAAERERFATVAREVAELRRARSPDVARSPASAPSAGEDMLVKLRSILADAAEDMEDEDDEPTPQGVGSPRLA